MKKILIISYFFADKTKVGSNRINGLAKFLPLFGWEPVILTTDFVENHDPPCRVTTTPWEDEAARWKRILGLDTNKSLNEQIEAKNFDMNRIAMDLFTNIFNDIFTYPHKSVVRWTPVAKAGADLIESEHFDAIMSSSGPISCNLIANYLRSKYNLPWIADFRDLWTQNPYLRSSKIRKIFEKKLEVKTLSLAEALITVSKPLASKLMQLHPGKNIYCITNGFDPDLKNPGRPLKEKFTIAYTGTLYRGKQDPNPLFNALENLISEKLIDKKKITIEFYGRRENWLKTEAIKYNIEDIVNINGLIPKQDAIEVQRRSHLLLLLNWNDSEEDGIYTGKIFDYLAAQRTIISISHTGGVVEDLLKETNAGAQCSTINEIEKFVLNAYQEFQIQKAVTYKGNQSSIDRYSHLEMARKFSEVLDLLESKNQMMKLHTKE